MFFDEPMEDDRYPGLLAEIAKKQHEILQYCFDWKERLPKKEAGSRRFPLGNRKVKDNYYGKLLQELDVVRNRAENFHESQGYPNGIFWWKVPWEQVEKYLLYDLTEIKEEGGWRYEYHWEVCRQKDRNVLLLREEGHFSDFSNSVFCEYAEDSAYTAAERDDMVRELDKKMKKYALRDMLWDDRPVYSEDTGILYGSKEDFYDSLEYYSDKEFIKSVYARNLYTKHETVGVQAVSHSLHYECIFAVADFHVRLDGVVDDIGLHGFEMCGFRGDTPSGIGNKYANRDAVVACAAFLADWPEAKKVPIQLFGRRVEEGAVDFGEALRQAEIYTCLSGKM